VRFLYEGISHYITVCGTIFLILGVKLYLSAVLYETAVSSYNGLQNVGIYVGKVVDICTSFCRRGVTSTVWSQSYWNGGG